MGYASPRVFYSHERIPGRNERTGGALIKCQDLSNRFPNTVRDANILYMINSAMPIHVAPMIREAKRHGAIIVLNQNGVAYEGWHGPGWEKTNAPMRFLLESADYIFYQSAFCKMGADTFLAPPSAPWRILHNPVDTRVFVPASCRPSGVRLLLAGSHQHFYRVKSAIEMMTHLLPDVPEATLTIAGRYAWRTSGQDCMAEAEALVRSLKLNNHVELKGGYSQAEAVALFQEHHVLIHTKYNDPCPRLIAEALSCGLPVVFSYSGGVPELVGAEAGEGVPSLLDWTTDHPPAPDDIAEAVKTVLQELEYRSLAARRRAVENLDVRDWLAAHEAVFLDLLGRRASPVN